MQRESTADTHEHTHTHTPRTVKSESLEARTVGKHLWCWQACWGTGAGGCRLQSTRGCPEAVETTVNIHTA